MCQNVHGELVWRGHQVFVDLALSEASKIESVRQYQPDLIICPMLTTRIPEEIWRKYVCLVVHPGIVGDRGACSLDWAILEGETVWGVTILQAAEEFDAGDIWSIQTFSMRLASKSSIYRDEVVRSGVKGVVEAVERFESGLFKPRPLNYSDPGVRGILRPNMTQADRAIDWSSDSTLDVIRKIRSADSVPGLLDKLFGDEYYLYGACEEDSLHGRRPGEIIAKRNGAICRATVDGALWISHMKKKDPDRHATFKLPATMVLGQHLIDVPEVPLDLLHSQDSKTFREIWYEERNNVGYLYFEFYNGAMSTDQCQRLREAFLGACKRRTKVIVLMGGRDFWSNGIHLNTIEAADDPADESMRNICAMDDLCQAILTTRSHITISALQGSAGAGGVMLGLAADLVYARSGLVLNPHYKSMGNLYGSEYWTYVLPKRVGEEKARELTDRCLPINIPEAMQIGLVDAVFTHEITDTFRDKVGRVADDIANSADYSKRMAEKLKHRLDDEKVQPLAVYRANELQQMKINFFGPDKSYHIARANFVHKVPLSGTPQHLLDLNDEVHGAQLAQE